IVLFRPAAHVGNRAVALEAFDFKRGAHDDGIPSRGKHQENQALAAPRIVAGEVLKIRTRLGDEEIEFAALQFFLEQLDAMGEDGRTEVGTLKRRKAEGVIRTRLY